MGDAGSLAPAVSVPQAGNLGPTGDCAGHGHGQRLQIHGAVDPHVGGVRLGYAERLARIRGLALEFGPQRRDDLSFHIHAGQTAREAARFRGSAFRLRPGRQDIENRLQGQIARP